MSRTIRFGLVGAAAALIHMTAFWLAQRWFGLENGPAWIVSFLAAASAAWAMNRNYTFRDRAGDGRRTEWLRYLAVAALGAAAHFLTFRATVAGVDFVASNPWLGIIPGSLASFIVTYAGASSLVFRNASRKP